MNVILKNLRFIILVTIFVLSGSGCGKAMLSDELLARQARNQFSELKKKEKVSTNADHQMLVQKIGKRISAVAQVDLPGTEWEFVVFEKSEANAFAMPGGKVGINSGLIDLANGNEDEIAAVIGHEIAHVAFRHSNKRMTQAMGIALGAVVLDAAMRDEKSSDRRLAGGAYGVGSALGVALPFSREQEQEADHRGLYYSAMAGYDPRGAISFWQKMLNEKKTRMPQFLSTHPDPGKRIDFLKANMDEAYSLYLQNKEATGENF